MRLEFLPYNSTSMPTQNTFTVQFCIHPQRPGSRDEAPTGNVRSVETSPDEGNRQETQEVRPDYLTFIWYIRVALTVH